MHELKDICHILYVGMPFRYIPVELPHGAKTAAFRFLHIEKRNDVGLFYLGKSGLSIDI